MINDYCDPLDDAAERAFHRRMLWRLGALTAAALALVLYFLYPIVTGA